MASAPAETEDEDLKILGERFVNSTMAVSQYLYNFTETENVPGNYDVRYVNARDFVHGQLSVVRRLLTFGSVSDSRCDAMRYDLTARV